MTDDPRQPVDGPTAMSPTSGHLQGGAPEEPTIPDEGLAGYGPSTYNPVTGEPDEPTQAPSSATDEPTLAETPPPRDDEPTLAPPNEPTPGEPSPLGAPAGSGIDGGPTIAHPASQNESAQAEPTALTPGGVDGGPTAVHSIWQEQPPYAEPATFSQPVSGGVDGGPTIVHPTWQNEPTQAEPTLAGADDGPSPHTTGQNEPTVAAGDEPVPAWLSEPMVDGGPTVAQPVTWGDEPTVDEPTVAVGGDEPTTTGPTVASWPLDQFEPLPPGELIWQPDVAPAASPSGRSPAYYVTLGAAVVLVIGLVGLAALVTVVRPRHEVAGTASAGMPPQISAPSTAPTTTTSSTAPPQDGPLADLAAHPLSSSTTRMPDATCALPRFDPADDKQAAFFAAAEKCADDAWRPVLQGIEVTGDVKVVTVTGTPAQTQSCGEIAPTNAPTECDGTVYMTPAYLRDQEQLGRYPGKYLGIFLREYARALQFTTGLEELVGKVTSGSAADLDTKTDQQATCLAGVASGAMAGRGAVDTNITGEIRQRLTTGDAPPDAQALLDKGFQQRTPAACNTWQS